MNENKVCPCCGTILEREMPDTAKRIIDKLTNRPRARLKIWFWNDGEVNRARIEDPDRLKTERKLVSKVGVKYLIDKGLVECVSSGVDIGQGRMYRLK